MYGSFYHGDWFKNIPSMKIKPMYDLILFLSPLPFVFDGTRYQTSQSELDELYNIINLYSSKFTNNLVHIHDKDRDRRVDLAFRTIDGM